MFKNAASQKIALFVFDVTTNLPKTGDAANLTAYVSKDHGAVTVLADTSATEMDATNAKGWYAFDLAQAETNGDTLIFSGKSTTANITVVGRDIYTLPNLMSSLAIDSSGRVTIGAVAAGAITAAAFAANALDAVWSTAARTLTGFGTLVADIWANATRTLTSGVNIVLAKGTGVTGFNDLSAAQVKTEAASALTDAGVSTTVMARLDVSISTRLAAASYTAPDNASISSINTKTANLPTDPASESLLEAFITAAILPVATQASLNASKAILDKLNTTLQVSGLNWKFTADALSLAPSGGGGATPPTPAENAAGLLDLPDGVETGETVRQYFRLMRAVIVGISVETDGTIVFKRKDGSTTAVTVAHTSGGSRPSVSIGTL